MAKTGWFKKNRDAIQRRTAWLKQIHQGIIYDKKSPQHRIIIRKEGALIRCFFVDPFITDSPYLRSSGAMSEYDLNDPLKLIIAYTQAFLLPLLWNKDPKHVYMIGFSGGRVPLVFHHYFPEIIIESTDIDSDTYTVAKKYFGIEFDKRQKLVIQDGRSFLERRIDKPLFDFIFIDAFRGTGYGPYHLCTVDFLQLCQKNMPPNGVVAINLVSSDLLFWQKINAMKAVFNNVYVHYDPTFIETYVILGTNDTVLDEAERIKRATELMQNHDFQCPLDQRARDLKPLDDQFSHLSQYNFTNEILVDGEKIPDVLSKLSPANPIFYNTKENDLCPCGSRRRFIECHGKVDSA